MASSSRRVLGATFTLFSVLCVTSSAFAQRTVPRAAAEVSSVSGVVETPEGKRQIPVAGVMVTLHRVGNDTSGPVDSVRSDAQGRYTINYHRIEGEGVYFAAALFRGIAYFSAPIRTARATGEESEITVFDTTSRGVDLHVQGHHVVVSAPNAEGKRDVVEVWELSNDTTVTLVGRDTLSPVWSAEIPHEATNLVGGQGDVAASSFLRAGDRVTVVAPFGPGIKQISYSYTLPSSAFPFDVKLVKRTSVLEVLLEEQTAEASGALLKATASASTQGRTFRRYQAQDVPAGQSLRISVPFTSAASREKLLIALLSVIGVVMFGALARAFVVRRGRVRYVEAPQPNVIESLTADIAFLDAQHERAEAGGDTADYQRKREALKVRLGAALNAQRGAS